MIKVIDNINFKSIIIPKYPQLSNSQEKVVKDIQTKLGDKAEKKHFLITPLKDDVVELSQVYNVKNIGSGINKKIQYSDPLFIGRYNEEHPFEVEDYKNTHKQLLKDLGGLLSFICFLLPTVLGLLYVTTTKNSDKTEQTQKVITATKDSLQILKKDSISVSKDSLRMFK